MRLNKNKIFLTIMEYLIKILIYLKKISKPTFIYIFIILVPISIIYIISLIEIFTFSKSTMEIFYYFFTIFCSFFENISANSQTVEDTNLFNSEPFDKESIKNIYQNNNTSLNKNFESKINNSTKSNIISITMITFCLICFFK